MRSPLPKSLLRKKYSLDSHKTTLLCVSRLSKEKNLPTLLHILSKLNQSENFQACIVGTGPEKDQLLNLALSLGLSNVVHFLGAVAFSSMPEVYSLADIFVYPSQTDTQAIVVSEALGS